MTGLVACAKTGGWGLDSASQGQCAEDTTQGRSGGEGDEESQWTRDHGRFCGNPCSGIGSTTTFQARQLRRVVQVETDEDQSHEFWILSTEVRAFQSFSGGMAQLSRVGPPQVEECRTQEKTLGRQTTGFSETPVVKVWQREGERSHPSSSGGSSSRRLAESSSVSKASDTRPSASSSHHHHHSVGDRRSLSSTSSRASPDRRSPPSHHERRRESADRTGQMYVARRDVQLSPKIAKPPEKRTITVVSSPARQVQVESASEFQVPAPVTDSPAGDDRATCDGSATGDGPATARPQVTAQPQVTARP